LSGVLPPLQKELAASHRWGGLVPSLTGLNQEQPAKDLTEARRRFLPFSTATVELAKQLRKEDPALAGLKIYHCPMAPKPGLWIQSKPPLANPFYGAEMLRCGQEVQE
jgi:Cu(I)/Ag(I) efflux system membrane fusion protein